MPKFQNKYRSESTRLIGWDYRHSGAYFITICTQNREHFFGECHNGKMKLSTAGMIVQSCWFQIFYLYANVKLGAFVVMPNHIHGILIIDNHIVDALESNASTISSNASTISSNASTKSSTISPNSPKTNSPTITSDNSEHINKNQYFQNLSPKSGSVSRIIQQYKTVCTKHIKTACPELKFQWQSLFHDHIIRNEKSFENISNYIVSNPKKWNADKFNNPKEK